MIAIVPLAAEHRTAVEALLDRAFEPGRQARTAYRVRGAARPIAALSFVATDDGRLVGSIQCWPVRLDADAGGTTPLVMVGPVAVDPEHQRDGLGRVLVRHALDAAKREGLDDRLVLIGDPEYYGRFFGFAATRTGRWRLPGPVEPRRLLALGDAIPDEAGVLGPR